MLSGNDIIDFFHHCNLKTPNIIRYPEIKESGINIDDIDISECNIILYEAVPQIGHWITVFYDQTNDKVEFFDPLGYFLDEQLDFSYHKEPDLMKMFVDSDNIDFEINHVKYQQPNTDTCGIWCCLRYVLSRAGVGPEEFKSIFYDSINKKSRDKFVRDLYHSILEVETPELS